MMLLARGIVTAVEDTQPMQTLSLSLLADENKTGVERFQDYGFTSNPPKGLEALVGFIGGNRSHGVVLAVGDRQYRLHPLETGELALYDDQGQIVHLKRDGIVLDSAFAIIHRAPLITLDGDVHITGETTSDGDVIAEGVSLTTHPHAGVTPGGGQSGGPIAEA